MMHPGSMLASDISHPVALPVLKQSHSEGSLLLCEVEDGDHFILAPESPPAARSGARSGGHSPVSTAVWEFQSLSCPPSVCTSKTSSPIAMHTPPERRSSVDVAGMREWLREQGFPEADEQFSDAYLTLVQPVSQPLASQCPAAIVAQFTRLCVQCPPQQLLAIFG